MAKERQTDATKVKRLVYTFNEASELLGLHHRTLRLFAKRGELETVRFGRAVRIPCDGLERFVEERRSLSTSANADCQKHEAQQADKRREGVGS